MTSLHTIAVVGAGAIAGKHVQIVSEMPEAVFAGCCDTGSGRAAVLCKQFGGRMYPDWQSMMSDPAVDVVIVATPSGRHMEPAIAAAKAGKHVLCEKPLEITLQRAQAMIDAHKAAGTRLGGIFQSRFMDAAAELGRAVASKRFGRITHAAVAVPWWRSQDYYDGTWRGTWGIDGGGALMNQSIHTIDLLISLMGEPVEVKALAGTLGHTIEAEDTLAAAVRFADGAIGTIFGTTAAWPGRARQLEISGTDGTAVLVDDALTVWQFRDKRPEDDRVIGTTGQSCFGGASNPMDIGTVYLQRNIRAFLAAVDENREFELNGTEAIKAVRLIRRLYADSGLV
jgi:UDP-N-acetyl-2-amino-2-deoxyglucuronate dehydrogenase